MKLKFNHSVYATLKHVGGNAPDIPSKALRDLLNGVDSATDRGKGMFFDTIDGQFILGWQRPRQDADSRDGSMTFFDIFSTPVINLEDVSLVALRNQLYTEQTPGVKAEVDPEITVKVRSNALDQSSPFVESPSVEEGVSANEWADDSTASVVPDVKSVAMHLERFRRDDTKMHLTIEQVDSLTTLVAGLLPELNFVSVDRKDAFYFEVIGEPNESPVSLNRETVRDLSAQIKELHTENRLRWSNIDTYEDKYRTIISRYQKEIKASVGTTSSEKQSTYLGQVRAEFKRRLTQIEKEIQQQQNDSVDLFTQILNGEIESEEKEAEGGLTSSLQSAVGLDDSEPEEYEKAIQRIQTNSIKDATKLAVAKEYYTSYPDNVQTKIQDELAKLQADLDDIAEQETEALLQEILTKSDEVLSSDVYARVQKSDQSNG